MGIVKLTKAFTNSTHPSSLFIDPIIFSLVFNQCSSRSEEFLDDG